MPAPIVAAIALDDVARGAAVAVGTVVAVVAVLLVGGLLLLFRRRSGAQPSSAAGLADLHTRSSIALVRADDAVHAAADELGFAVAQFGEERAAPFAATLAEARGRLAEPFRLRRELDDAVPESAQRGREWALQIIALCEEVAAELAGHTSDFAALRGSEAEAPRRIAELRRAVVAARAAVAPATAAVERLAGVYDPELLAPVRGAGDAAAEELDSATECLDEAASRLSATGGGADASGTDGGGTTGRGATGSDTNDGGAIGSDTIGSGTIDGGATNRGGTVAGLLEDASGALARAVARLDAVDAVGLEIAGAASALESLVAATRADLVEARAQRDSAPDADSVAAVIAAVAEVEAVLAAGTAVGTTGGTAHGTANPVAQLEALSSAIASLDTALAGARNQTQRLEHARTALTGALIGARSQIATTRALIDSGARRGDSGGPRIGADARSRLAEAERQLMLAETESDPVEALDAARRAATHARDADALARYDAMGTS